MSNYEAALEWALEKGLFLHHEIKRGEVNGIPGMFASGSIPAGELLASFPKNKVLPDRPEDYPVDASLSARRIHAAAKAYQEDKTSPLFSLFDTEEQLAAISPHFYDAKELAAIKAASDSLYLEVWRQNQLNRDLIEGLYAYDPSIERQIYTLVVLNYNSRAIGRSGFMPILELFNHSDAVGAYIDSQGDQVSLKAKVDYSPGDQVFISYGVMDLYRHAINYNYFDPEGEHFIEFSRRFDFPILNSTLKAAAQKLSSSYPVAIEQKNGVHSFRVGNDQIYFGEEGPSEKLLELVGSLSQLFYGKTDTKATLLSLLEKLKASNHIDQCGAKHFTKKLRRFGGVLKKERKILTTNINWVKANL